MTEHAQLSQFSAQLRDRAQQALHSLAEAQDAGDLYSAHVHSGDLESIARLADDHDLHLPELDPFRTRVA